MKLKGMVNMALISLFIIAAGYMCTDHKRILIYQIWQRRI